jgi:hypothetical protein
MSRPRVTIWDIPVGAMGEARMTFLSMREDWKSNSGHAFVLLCDFRSDNSVGAEKYLIPLLNACYPVAYFHRLTCSVCQSFNAYQLLEVKGVVREALHT